MDEEDERFRRLLDVYNYLIDELGYSEQGALRKVSLQHGPDEYP